MTIKEKIMDWAFDHCEWLYFLLSDHVSTRFTILNLLSGDALRNSICFVNVSVKNLKWYYDELAGMKEAFGEDFTIDKYDAWARQIGWYIDRTISECNNFWQL